jgi:hypothetical protein
MTSIEGGAEEIDNFLSTVIATGNDLEKNIELTKKPSNQHAGELSNTHRRLIRTARRNQSRVGRSD